MVTLKDLLIRITQEILNPLIVLVFLLAVAAFGWGMVMYLGAQGSDEKVQKSKKIMWFCIIGMFVLISVWGSVYLLCDFFGTCAPGKFSFPSFSPSGQLVNPRGTIVTPQGEMLIDQDFLEGIGGSPPSGVGITTLTPTQQTACLNSPSVCEPCLHFLNEGNPRGYVKCVKKILGF